MDLSKMNSAQRARVVEIKRYCIAVLRESGVGKIRRWGDVVRFANGQEFTLQQLVERRMARLAMG